MTSHAVLSIAEGYLDHPRGCGVNEAGIHPGQFVTRSLKTNEGMIQFLRLYVYKAC